MHWNVTAKAWYSHNLKEPDLLASWFFEILLNILKRKAMCLKREGTPGRHEPPLCSHAEMSICSTSNCVCVIKEVCINLC